MVQDEAGRVVKRCATCGKKLLIEDWFAAMSTKYCQTCAQNQHRITTANCMKEARRKARERRKLEAEQTRQTMRENDLLREAVREQAARIAELEGRLKK